MKLALLIKYELHQLVHSLLYFLYPPVCLGCQSLFEPENENIYYCQKCWSECALLNNKHCPRCLKLLNEDESDLSECETCKNRGYSFGRLYSAALFHGRVRDALLRFKFGGMRKLASPLSQLIIDQMPADFQAPDYDYLLPIPLHWRRRLSRGYNQSDDLARCLGREWGLPIANNMVKRVKATPPLSGLDYLKRSRVIKNSFEVCDKQQVSEKSFLVIDDIATGRFTINECARILKRAGATRVDGVTVAISAF